MDGQVVTVDTNIAFYALEEERTDKALVARAALRKVDFLSVQVLNEYANSARRKLRRSWAEIDYDLGLLRGAIPKICAIDPAANRNALDLAERYKHSFYDSLMIAVALENGATTLYSEDMQHGLVIDETLTITNPFLSTETQ